MQDTLERSGNKTTAGADLDYVARAIGHDTEACHFDTCDMPDDMRNCVIRTQADLDALMCELQLANATSLVGR